MKDLNTTAIKMLSCFFFAPFSSPTWKLSRKFSCTGRSLWERRILLLDTKVVNYSDFGRRERTSAGSVFQHLSREQKEGGNAYYLAISDRPNFPSPFRSNIRSYKVKAAYRWKGREGKQPQRKVHLPLFISYSSCQIRGNGQQQLKLAEKFKYKLNRL